MSEKFILNGAFPDIPSQGVSDEPQIIVEDFDEPEVLEISQTSTGFLNASFENTLVE